MVKKTFLLPLLLLSLMLWLQPTTPVSADLVHDVAVVEVKTFSPVHGAILGYPYIVTECYETWRVSINVTVENEGDFAESFTVQTFYGNSTGNYTIGISPASYSVTLAPGANTTLTFIWYNPKYIHVWPYSVYYVSAEASVVEGENETADNSMVDGSVKVKCIGDVNGDGHVDIYDLTKLALSWGRFAKRYDPQCDFGSSAGVWDGEVNVFDLTKLALWWHRGPLDLRK